MKLYAFIVTGLVTLSSLSGQAQSMGPTPAHSPKNVILMIADGTGFNHLRAASSFLSGRTNGLACDAFPVQLAVSTFSANGQGYDPQCAATNMDYVKSHPTDSAASATALATGHKTGNGALGVDSENRPLSNAVEVAVASGRSAGLITTVPLSHATPAGFSAHSKDRGQYAGIARQMLEGSPLTVLMGGGHPQYDADGNALLLPGRSDYVGGLELWEKIRKNELIGAKTATAPAGPWTLVEDRSAFVALATGAVPARVLGVAMVSETLQQRRTSGKDWNNDGKIDAADAAAVPAFGDAFVTNVPTLSEMTRAALNVLAGNPHGLFLMIEGGAVDWAAHGNQAGRMIEEAADFNDAIRAVCEWVEAHGGWDETLLVITADHETGYLQGTGGVVSEKGPLYKSVLAGEKGKMPEVTWSSKGHTNQLVPLYAKGRFSDRFVERARGMDPLRGPYLDNTDIGQVLIDALRAR